MVFIWLVTGVARLAGVRFHCFALLHVADWPRHAFARRFSDFRSRAPFFVKFSVLPGMRSSGSKFRAATRHRAPRHTAIWRFLTARGPRHTADFWSIAPRSRCALSGAHISGHSGSSPYSPRASVVWSIIPVWTTMRACFLASSMASGAATEPRRPVELGRSRRFPLPDTALGRRPEPLGRSDEFLQLVL